MKWSLWGLNDVLIKSNFIAYNKVFVQDISSCSLAVGRGGVRSSGGKCSTGF